MTYLATEMLLYLISAAVIGLVLGWLVWGVGRRRQIRELHDDLSQRLDDEISAHEDTRHALANADARMKQTADLAKADAVRSLGELKQSLDKEREKAEMAEAELTRLRAELEESVFRGHASDQAALDEAMRVANTEKAAAAEAMTKEAQSRAQIEELRLLIGAEKLSAEAARNELEHTRAGMQAELDAERSAHNKAKIALEDIRSTLAKTFGAEAANMVAGGANTGTGWQGASESNTAARRGEASSLNMMTDFAAAGDALNNPDLDEADIEDREDTTLDLSPNIDVEAAPRLEVKVSEAPDDDDQSRAVPDRIELQPLTSKPIELSRPANALPRHPDDADDLQAIEGITPEIVKQLHESGCYYFHQLAAMTAGDIDGLAKAVSVTPDRIARDRWIQQAKRLAVQDDDAEAEDSESDQFLFKAADRKSTG